MYPSIHDIVKIARTAGDEIMALRDAVVKNAVNKADGSPVTEADKRASDIVIKGLGRLTPEIPVISEERDDAENRAILAAHDTYWIVDPLDGTRSYIDGHDGFGVHIGLIENGVPKLAAIYFPAQGIVYYTDGTHGAFMHKDGEAQPRKLTAPAALENNTLRLALSWVKRRQPLQDDIAYTPVPAVGGARVCVVAEGLADLALIEGPFSYWDIAAAHALLKAAGGELYDLKTGAPVIYTNDKLYIAPAIGGDPALVFAHRADIAQAVARLPLKPPVINPPKP